MYKTAVTSFQPLSLTFVMLLLFFFIVASLIFIFEPCREIGCTFQDVFNTGYFVIITLTTVGFGDQIPHNNMARFVAVLTMLAGAVFLSMPIAVIGNQYEAAYNDEHEKETAMKDPVQRKRLMAERHLINTRNRKQRVLNTSISLTCYVCRVEEFDRKHDRNPKSPQKSIEELMQNGNENSVSDETETRSKYVVKFDMEPQRKSDEYIEKYRNALLRRISRYHSLFLIDVRELFDLTRGMEKDACTEILRSHTLKIDASKIIRKKTHEIFYERGMRMLSACADIIKQKGHDRFLKSEYQRLLETTQKDKITIKDKVWIRCELDNIDRFSHHIYQLRMFMMLLCVLSSFAHTMQSFNDYGEGQPSLQTGREYIL